MSVCVAVVNGIVVAVCKQILRSGTAVVDKAVRANKPPELRVIIPAIQVIQPRLGVVIVPPVAEGVFVAHGVAGGVGDSAVAPGVVAVGGNDLAGGGADDGYNVSLQVVEVVEQHGTVGKAHALAGAVVEEAHNGIPGLLRQNLAAVEEEFRSGAVDRFGRSDTVGVVLIAVSIAAVGDFPQLPAHPGVAGAVVAGHVADAVVGDGLAVVLGQQIRPAAVAIGVSFGLQNLSQGAGRIGVPLYRLDVPSVSADMLRPSVILFIFLQLQYLDQTFPQLFILGDIKSAYLLGNIDTLSAKRNTCHQSAIFEPLFHAAIDHAPKWRRNAIHAEN